MVTVTVFIFTGMLSKSKGQILRVAATMHALFHWETPGAIPETISDEALKAAVCFVELCVQHAAFLAGRGNVAEEIDSIPDQGMITMYVNLKTGCALRCRFYNMVKREIT